MDVTKIDISNCVAILITADNIKMDSLVAECVQFIYRNLEEILRAHVTFAGVKESLLRKIAVSFSYNELDGLKDKKDKIKSILFRKLVEQLFETENGAKSLFFCSECRLLLTEEIQSKIRCIPTQLAIDRHGELISLHVKDELFDSEKYLEIALSELGTWRRVFWHIWGLINILHCTTCNEYFRCCDVGKCRYHPEDPEYRRHFQKHPRQSPSKPYINYICCQQNVIRFDPLQINTGCQMQDHTIDQSSNNLSSIKIYPDLLEHRTFACATVDLETEEDKNPHLKLRRQSSCITWSQGIQEIGDEITSDVESTDDSLEETDTQETNLRYLRKIAKWKWNPKHPTRFNHDMQRDHEQIKMTKLTQQLLNAVLNQSNPPKNHPQKTPGGIYARIEAEWKEKHSLTKKNPLPSQSTRSALWKNRR